MFKEFSSLIRKHSVAQPVNLDFLGKCCSEGIGQTQLKACFEAGGCVREAPASRQKYQRQPGENTFSFGPCLGAVLAKDGW